MIFCLTNALNKHMKPETTVIVVSDETDMIDSVLKILVCIDLFASVQQILLEVVMWKYNCVLLCDTK